MTIEHPFLCVKSGGFVLLEAIFTTSLLTVREIKLIDRGIIATARHQNGAWFQSKQLFER